jgi:hypothetical protein
MVPMLPLARARAARRSPSESEMLDTVCDVTVDSDMEEENAMLGSEWYHKSPKAPSHAHTHPRTRTKQSGVRVFLAVMS